ncbi:ATP-dependent DNA helicase recG-like protein [Kineothrix alysoides]|uniref:ATP-dependent DNA helicase recG-like protein n=1 Tax=Kineothrix alysoides TaxID=1469948 RepID=A0A4R1QMQ7_9FIRM|nr:winged helix-turn-helix transcriptional regulator [Kineothrix alysoides]TCL54233.1 ATP-dependent DNA helicase recG-like protein [Kineothrix alysoides]
MMSFLVEATGFEPATSADVKVTATSQLAYMYISKQNIFTEKRIFPYMSLNDLRIDLLPRIRKMATNNIEGIHGWESMTDEGLLRNAGLYGTDRATGEKGYNLARESICQINFSWKVQNVKIYGMITPENIEPNPKNPIIASFFRSIGWLDRLGSGVRNLFKYSKYYSGQEPEFIEGDVFRIIVPLNEKYSYDLLNEKMNGSNSQYKSDQSDQSNQIVENLEERLIKLLAEKPDIKTKEITELLGWSSSQVKYYMKKLKDDNKVTRHGTNRNGYWEIL